MGLMRNGPGAKVVIFAFLVFLVSAACSSDPTAPEADGLPQGLFGTWSWVRATGGIAGVTQTPDTEGYTKTITFTAPNQVQVFRNGVLEIATTFEFVPATGDGSEAQSARLLYSEPLTGFDEQGVDITTEGGLILLVLTDPCCDGFTYEWRRT